MNSSKLFGSGSPLISILQQPIYWTYSESIVVRACSETQLNLGLSIEYMNTEVLIVGSAENWLILQNILQSRNYCSLCKNHVNVQDLILLWYMNRYLKNLRSMKLLIYLVIWYYKNDPFLFSFIPQLDASELDSEVVHIVKAQLNKLFKYHKVNK